MTDEAQYRVKEASVNQKLETYKNTCSTWGRGLTLEKYLQREEILSQVAFGQTNLKVWVLVDQRDKDEKVLSHLETYRRPVYYKLSDGEVKESSLYSICSVFTPEDCRGKRYASKLFDLLIPQLEDSFGATLYSDIGTFYEKFGFLPYSASEYQFPTQQKLALDSEEIPFLNEAEIEVICENNCKEVVDKLRSQPEAAFFIKPDLACLQWHWARAKFYALHKGVDQDLVWGCASSSGDGDGFLVWTLDFPNNCLKVLHGNRVDSYLVSKAIRYATSLGLDKVTLWEENKRIFEGLESKFVLREDSLPYMRFTNTNLDGKVKWVGNFAYGWV